MQVFSRGVKIITSLDCYDGGFNKNVFPTMRAFNHPLSIISPLYNVMLVV